MMKTTRLLESGVAKGTGKRWEAKIIAANVWGSSMYYDEAVLRQYAATALPVGTKMFENHLSESEMWERPVGDVSKLVGKLVSEGRYVADHPEGPGVYADVEFYDSYVSRIAEIGTDVGLSVDGAADYVEGERDGRFGRIATSIPYIKSVDVVVAAGAGGKLVSIQESAGLMAWRYNNNFEGDQSMAEITKEDLAEGFKALGETLTASIRESLEGLVAPAAPAVAEPVAQTTVEVTQEAVVDTPAAEVTAEITPEAVADATAEDKPEIDLAEVAVKIVQANLPKEAVGLVMAEINSGKSVDEAIATQTTIREAYLSRDTESLVRVVESDRGNNQPGNLRAQILNNFKK